jgi:uncharacterized repeat protein (TIGR03803 family)
MDQNGNLYGTTLYGGISNSTFTLGMGTLFELTSGGILSNLVTFNGTNGAIPSGLIRGSDGNFYGETKEGGQGAGTIFKFTTNGVLTTLATFTTVGNYPFGGLLQTSDGTFWGTTEYGGSYGGGIVFSVATNGNLNYLLSFGKSNNAANPTGGLIQGSGGTFYGTSASGGVYTNGTVFSVTTNGILTTIFSFNGTNGSAPQDRLVFGLDGTLYGTTYGGGTNGAGTVFGVTTNNQLNMSVSFDGANEGSEPSAGLILGSDGNLYGTAYQGGACGYGTVFSMTSNGVLRVIAPFCDYNGIGPRGGIVQDSDGSFYGTTFFGGTNGSFGTVFKIATNGTFSTLLSFDGTNGERPETQLLKLADGKFYGTTYGGGVTNMNYTLGMGTVFNMTTNGTLTTLTIFNGANGIEPGNCLSLGADGSLYGTTSYGGNLTLNSGNGFGTVFKMATNGELTTLAAFNGTNGSEPNSKLVFASGGIIYGSTVTGGVDNYGTVFSLDPSGNLTTLASFLGTNGMSPVGGLLQGADGNLYGTTASSLKSGVTGTVFKVTTGGILTTLAALTSATGTFPSGWLVQGNDGNLYGTAEEGGSGGGSVFGVTTNGIITNVAFFTGANGQFPQCGLVQGIDGYFYGLASEGGVGAGTHSGLGYGTFFRFVIGNPPQITFPLYPREYLVEQYVGGTIGLTVTATGAAPMGFQWAKNSVNLVDGGHISGSGTSVLTLNPVFASDAGIYSIVAINPIGAAYGGFYDLYTLSPIMPELTNSTVTSPGIFNFTFTGTANISYHVWASTDLVSWLPLNLATQTVAGTYGFSDPSATNYQTRFYQLRVP